MTSKAKVLLLAALIASFTVNNCTTVAHDASMRTELAIKSDKHNTLARPIEVTHEIQDKNLTGEASGMILWIPLVFDGVVGVAGLVGIVTGTITKVLGGIFSNIPFVGKKIGDGSETASENLGNIGPMISNAKILQLAKEAESKAVFENNIDGFFRINVQAQIGLKWIIFKEYKVQVTGKPIVIKNLGQFSDARLAKLQSMTAKAGCTTCADVK